jgi:hypothetical protein
MLSQLALDTLLKQALVEVREDIVPLPDRDGYTGWFQLKRDVDSGSNRGYGGRPLGATSGRGRRTSDERLLKVADTYLSAVAAGKPPTQAVADELHVTRAHAGRLVGLARAAGHIAKTSRGKVSTSKQ